MNKWFSILILVLSSMHLKGQIPFYYKIKNIKGVIYDKDHNAVKIDFHSRRELRIENCPDQELEKFLQTLTLAKHGRQALEFLLTTSAKVTVNISEKVGIIYYDGKYRLMGGLSGPNMNQSLNLIANEIYRSKWNTIFNKHKDYMVHEENTIEIFKGSVSYINDSSFVLENSKVKLFNLETGEYISNFSMDTIKIEPLTHPDMFYDNFKELFYFCGIHEIFHLTPKNLAINQMNGNPEIEAMKLESKAFRRREKLNKNNYRH